MSDFNELENSLSNISHAQEFTKIENSAAVYLLRSWLGAGGQVDKASDILRAGDDAWATTTMFEHFASKLNERAGTRTPTNMKVYDFLQGKAKAAQDKVNELLGRDDEEDERINDITDELAKAAKDVARG